MQQTNNATVIAEKPLAVCGYRKFQVDALGDHLCTCTFHSGVKKAHVWVVDQLPDLFHTHTVKVSGVLSDTTTTCLFLLYSNLGFEIFSSRIHLYVLILI
jgi:hypothetical protein